jgi:YVTN family beta-propeller protein
MPAPPVLAEAAATLTEEARIPLAEARGRIDHLAFDAARGRLYVAELGSDSVGIIDVKSRRVIRTSGGFDEPQGIGYEADSDTVYVANGGDGSVRMFRGEDFTPLGRLTPGDDADNVRVDQAAHRVYVGYGAGALAVIDSTTRRKVADILLQGHPESFQLDPAGNNIFVNVPDAHHIAVVDRAAQRQLTAWPTGDSRANFPMALDAARDGVISVFRHPARLETYEVRTGRRMDRSDVCTDSDDVFVDARRGRVYVICGEGYVDVFETSADRLVRIERVATARGSRTGLFVPELDRLFVALRAGEEPAALLILRPSP